MVNFNTYNQAVDYANNVVNGFIVCGTLTIKAAKRFLSDLEREDIYIDIDKVNHCLSFLNKLKHYKGSFARKPFILSDWQVFYVANIVGWKRKSDGARRCTNSYLQVGRKNGKSFLAGALSLYFLIADGEKASEVLLLANSKIQAKDVDFEVVKSLALQLDPKQKKLKAWRDSVDLPKTKARLKVLSSDQKTGDGYNTHFGLIDEYHQAPTSAMRDLVTTSMGSRTNPHCAVITTAGFNKNFPCYMLREYCIDVLTGLKQDDSLFALIYELDIDDDWKNTAMWAKANPNIGISLNNNYMVTQITKATNDKNEEVNILTKNLNRWCDASVTQWIPDNYIYNNFHNNTLEFYAGNTCYLGLDLASTLDLTAISVMFPLLDGGYDFIQYYYLPSDTVENSPNRELYKKWHREGYLNVTNGNVTDYEYIINDINRIQNICPIEQISFDQWNSSQLNISLSEQGYNMIPFSQSISSMNRPTKELQRLILSNKVHFDKNPITSWCFKNAIPKTDWNENLKIIKASNDKKIDGVVAAIMSMGGYLTTNKYQYDLI